MATTRTPPKTDFQQWKDGVDKAAGDTRWDSWDCEIQRTVSEYNRHLSTTSGYMPLDWLLIKAMLWVESGATNSEWNSRPMRIGVSDDPGLTSFLYGNEGGDLILPPAWKGKITANSARTLPVHNIRAGVGYLLMKMAYYEYRSVLSDDTKIYEVTTKPGDSLDKIAKAQGSTVDILKKLNPTVIALRSGQVLKYQKASIKRVIIGWRSFSTMTVALRYNSMQKDSNYAEKLDYALDLVRNGKTIACVH